MLILDAVMPGEKYPRQFGFLDLFEGFQTIHLLGLDAFNFQGDFHLVTHHQSTCLKKAVV